MVCLKIKIFKIPAILLLLAGFYFSCTERGNEIEIPIVGYFLTGTECLWTSLEPEKVVIVNSNKELEKYIENCGNDYPTIDFSKNTLLLVTGIANSSIVEIQTKLTKHTGYELNIDVYVGILGVLQKWDVALLSSKKIKGNVRLNFKQVTNLNNTQ